MIPTKFCAQFDGELLRTVIWLGHVPLKLVDQRDVTNVDIQLKTRHIDKIDTDWEGQSWGVIPYQIHELLGNFAMTSSDSFQIGQVWRHYTVERELLNSPWTESI